MKATETLKKSRNINISISLDAEALIRAMEDKKDEGDDDGEEKQTTAASMLRQSRNEPQIVKLSQIPMAG